MTHATCSRRQRASLLPWVEALRRLCRYGWSDRLAADVLSSLTLPAIERLLTGPRSGWKRDRLEQLCDECLDGQHEGERQQVSKRRVWCWRHRHRIKRTSVRISVDYPTLLQRRRVYQLSQGWGHLLPDGDEGGHVLRRRETDILCVLRDAGQPMTRAAIAQVIGLGGLLKGGGLMSEGRSNLRRLVLAGLVIRRPIKRVVGVQCLYSLSPEAIHRRELS